MNLPLFSAGEGLLIVVSFLAFFGLLTYGIAWVFSRDYVGTKPLFLLADRKLGFWESTFSITASWIWAPALFVSALQAYTNGWVGLFWFATPNFLCLILFALLVNKVVEKFPQGYSLSEFMQSRYSNRVQNMYWVALVGLTLGAFATQILAGGKFISMISGIDFLWASLLLTLIPLSYSMAFGLKSSVITDYAKVLVLFGIGAVLISLTVVDFGGFETIVAGINGTSGIESIFSEKGWIVFATFGLPTVIGLMSGPFGDQAFWQRAFSIKTEYRQKAFFIAAFLFILVPLSMSLLGFGAAGLQHVATDKQFVNLEMIAMSLGTIGVIAFSIMVLSGVTSILDSKLCAVSSIAGHDMAVRAGADEKGSMLISKLSMVLLAGIAFAIANIPGIQIVHLFLIYGALRASTLMPTLMTMLMERKLSEAGVFYGIVVSIVVGIPVFAYGLLNKIPSIAITGSAGGMLISGIIAYVWTVIEDKQKIYITK